MVHPLSGYSVPSTPTFGGCGNLEHPAEGRIKADYIQHPEKQFPVADETLVFNSRARVGGAHYLSLPEPQPSGGHRGGLKIPGAKHWSWRVQEGQGAISIPLPILLTSSTKYLSCQALKMHLPVCPWHLLTFFFFYCFALYLEKALWQADNDFFPTLILLCSHVFNCYYQKDSNPPIASASFLIRIREYY